MKDKAAYDIVADDQPHGYSGFRDFVHAGGKLVGCRVTIPLTINMRAMITPAMFAY